MAAIINPPPLMEYICRENEKDWHWLKGPAIRDVPKRPGPKER